MKRRATPRLPPAGWCAAIAVALVVGASGCASTSSLQWYEPAPAERSEPLADALEVLPVIDERPLKGRTSLGPGFLAIIPLVPYGHQQISPDRFTGNFPSEILGTVVADVRAAGVARQVFQKGDLLPGQAAPENAYTLHLRLTEGIFHRNVTLYGVSFFGAFLALVGLPTSYGRVEIGLDAEVKNATGESLGREQFRGTAGAKDWLYYPMPAAYPRKLPEAYAALSPELRRFLREALSP